MKNRVLSLFLACFFALTSSAFINIHDMDGIISLPIVLDKNAAPLSTIQIPDQYLSKDGQLLLPLEISLICDGKKILEAYSQLPVITLPALGAGDYYLEVAIGEFRTVMKFAL